MGPNPILIINAPFLMALSFIGFGVSVFVGGLRFWISWSLRFRVFGCLGFSVMCVVTAKVCVCVLSKFGEQAGRAFTSHGKLFLPNCCLASRGCIRFQLLCLYNFYWYWYLYCSYSCYCYCSFCCSSYFYYHYYHNYYQCLYYYYDCYCYFCCCDSHGSLSKLLSLFGSLIYNIIRHLIFRVPKKGP